ncbi:SRPBCC family protein [Breoghania sp. L-A4]|uniref:SRPBCC family protein n=1 Tax=Breoghania sp. L-A4 TaxID=2304600 RepID=UPI000E360B09|nr:SRPBCC family protein [Breoghania sp. L-A4]AXS39417.1 SRPBCC family protein [Breoghania sp. L-A4]
MKARTLALLRYKPSPALAFGLIVLLAALLALPAAAHGPTRKKVTETIEIDAPADVVWARIGDFQDMSWHPAVQSQTGEGGNAIDATRVLDLGNGATIDEVLYKYSADKMSYSYRITKVDVAVLPVTNYSSRLTVKPIDDTHTKVEWRGAFYRGYPNNDPPENLNDAAAIAAVTAVYRGGLDALKAELEAGQ